MLEADLGCLGREFQNPGFPGLKTLTGTHPFQLTDSLRYMGRGAAERGSEWGPLEGVVEDGGPPCLDLRIVLPFTITTVITHYYQH